MHLKNAIKSYIDKYMLVHEGCFIDRKAKGKVKDKWIIFTAGRMSTGNYNLNYREHTWTTEALVPLCRYNLVISFFLFNMCVQLRTDLHMKR